MKRALLAFLTATALVVGGIVLTSPASAASPGAGFGSWAPTSAYGWHGSMIVNGISTYCILPGEPVPTGDSADHGVVFDAAGLDPQRLTAINMLVSTYGQTSDPVQAASVGWAVKAIANWDATLHTFGYSGDSLQGAIHWTFSALAPEHDQAVQDLAAAYYAEAMAVPAGTAAGSGHLEFTTAGDDPSRGTMAVVTDVPSARGSVTLENAVFADTGTATRDDVVAGGTYSIEGVAPEGQSSYSVRGSGVLRGGFLPAVRWTTTPGGQDTAGTGGSLEFPIEGQDAVPRELVFAPTIATQVVSRYVEGGAYVDDVTFGTARGVWARTVEGGYAEITATATVYRTPTEPELSDDVPANAEPVGDLRVTTDAAAGPTAPYRVESDWTLAEPGFYTAVWRIDAREQGGAAREALADDYLWVERFGEQSQITMLVSVRSQAEPEVAVGGPMSDVVIVEGAVPRAGLRLATAVFRVPEGTDPAEACADDLLVWRSDAVLVLEEGSTSFTAPVVPDFGTYVWQETASDTADVLVHRGACGVPEETTRAPLPVVTTTALASSGLGGEVTDVATVSGRVPIDGVTEIGFDVYRSTGGDAAASCVPDTLVAQTGAVPVPGAGEYRSPGVRLHASGTYFWIEHLWYTPPGGERREIASGACGLPNESTVVEQPSAVTRAVERAAVGEEYTDLAVVTGLGDGVDAELVFSVYGNAADQPPTCTPETLETVTAPVPVTSSGEFRSPAVSSSRSGVKLWVAELRYRSTPDAEPVTLWTGGCGDAGETTHVDVLAVTGPGGELTLAITGGTGTLAVLGGTLLLMRRRFVAAPRTR